MAEISKQALKVDNNQSFPNNNNGAITPAILRAFNVNMIDSMVDELSYNADSASWNVSISNINAFTSSLQTAFVSTASFNSFTSSINAYTASNNIKWNNAEVATSSLFTSVTNLNQFTASQVGAFTELNAWSASAKVSIGALNQASSSLQSFTQSANVSITNLNTTTASLNSSVSQLNASSASQQISIDALNVSSASQQVSIDSLNSKTGSYATTGSNTFTSANTFTSISASSFVSASEFIGNGSKITGITASIALPILDEGIPQGNAFSMNFTGSGISAVVVGGTAVVSVNTPDSGTVNNLTASFNAYTSSTNLDLAAIHQATASLQSFTASFSTSSLVTTSSFNAYTASNDQRVTSLESNSASVNISVTNLNQATSSLFGSASLALVTASFNNGTRNLTFTKGDNQTFSVNIPDVSGSAGDFVTTSSFNAYTSSNDQKVNSLISATGSYATTGSNTFNGLQTIRATGGTPLIVDHSDASPTQNTLIGIFKSGSAEWSIGNLGTDDSFVVYNPNTFQTPLSIRQDNGVTLYGTLTASLAQGYTWVGNGSNVSSLVATSSFGTTINTGSFITTGSASTGSQTILGDFNFNTTYTSVQPVVNQAGGSNILGVDFGAFNDIINYWGGLNFAGVVVNGTGVTNATIPSYNFGSYLELTLSSGTTTNGLTYTLTGPVIQTISLTGSLESSYEVRAKDIATGQKAVMDVRGFYSVTADNSVQAGASTDGGVYTSLNTDTYNNIRLAVTSSQVNSNSGPTSFNKPQIAVGQNNQGSFTQISFEGNGDYTDGTITVHQPLFVSSSLNVRNTLTASLQTGYVWVGNGTGRTTTVATSSFGGGGTIPAGTISGSAQITALGFVSSSVTASSLVTASVTNNTITFTKGDASTFNITVNTGSAGGAAFPFTGDAVITGSLLVSGSGAPDVRVIGNIDLTGSMRVQPITLSVASNTASIDMNSGNNFVLTLPSSSVTHIAPSSIIAGQTINLLIKQQVGPATGSITFAPSIFFPSGVDMQATATGSAIDLVSMISFDTTNLMAANVKNLR